MKMLATLYEKIPLFKEGGHENEIFIFRPITYLKDFRLNMSSDLLSLNESEIARLPIDCDPDLLQITDSFFLNSNRKYGYDYPMTIEDLMKTYNTKSYEETCEFYENIVFGDIVFAVYSHKDNKYNTVVMSADELGLASDESWFYNFNVISSAVYNEEQEIEKSETVVEFDDEILKQLEELIKNNENEKVFKLLEMAKKKAHQVGDSIVFQEQKFLEEYANDSGNYYIENEFGLENSLDDVKIDIKQVEKKELKDCLSELDYLIGIKDIKKEINNLSQRLRFMNIVKDDVILDKPKMHMVFTGNPGTGKTTVARIIAEILYSLDYTNNGKFLEATAADFIAGYVGQTALKTRQVMEKCKGGLIFIDEAYSFSGEGQQYSEEALAEMLKEMETNNTVFVFAGYKDEMRKFIEMNPGLRSRVDRYIEFNDYSKEELYQMFENKMKKAKFKMGDGVKEKVLILIENAKNNKDFGNGRFIDKLFDNLITNHAVNIDDLDNADKETLITITEKDVSSDLSDTLVYKDKSSNIGFQYKK